MVDPTYKNLLILSEVIFWSSVALLLTKVRHGKHTSISQHAATSKRAIVLFGSVLVVFIGLLLLFVYKWFVPEFRLGWLFELILAVCSFSFVLGGIIPDTKGWMHKVHSKLARIGTLCLMPLLLIIVLSSQVGHGARVVDAVALTVMISAWIVIDVAKIQRSIDKFLIYQMAYFACFHGSLLVTTYWR